jgi:hypothetical protein
MEPTNTVKIHTSILYAKVLAVVRPPISRDRLNELCYTPDKELGSQLSTQAIRLAQAAPCQVSNSSMTLMKIKKEGNTYVGLFLPKQKHWESQCWWLTPIILATQEAEIRRITVQCQPGQMKPRLLSLLPE